MVRGAEVEYCPALLLIRRPKRPRMDRRKRLGIEAGVVASGIIADVVVEVAAWRALIPNSLAGEVEAIATAVTMTHQIVVRTMETPVAVVAVAEVIDSLHYGPRGASIAAYVATP